MAAQVTWLERSSLESYTIWSSYWSSFYEVNCYSTSHPSYVILLLLPQKLFNILPSLLSQYAITKLVWDQNLFVKFGYVNVFIIPWCWWWWVLGCRSNWQILLLRKCATRAWYPDILRRCAVRRAWHFAKVGAHTTALLLPVRVVKVRRRFHPQITKDWFCPQGRPLVLPTKAAHTQVGRMVIIAHTNVKTAPPTKITRLQFANLPAHQLDSNWIFSHNF